MTVRYRRILVAADFSESSRQALELASALAAVHGAQLHVLFIEELHSTPVNPAEDSRLSDWVRPTIERKMRESDTDGAVDIVRTTRRALSAAPAICEYAGEQDIDLIVAGTHGRRGISRLFLGSVAEELVRAAPVPVLITRGGDPARRARCAPILAPTDFSEPSKRAIAHAGAHAAANGARLIVQHVIEPMRLPPFYPEVWGRVHRDRIEIELAAFIRALNLPVKAEPLVSEGRAHHSISVAARDHEAGMIVMATAGLTGLDHILVGSVIERLLRVAPCPVLVYRPAAATVSRLEEVAAGR